MLHMLLGMGGYAELGPGNRWVRQEMVRGRFRDTVGRLMTLGIISEIGTDYYPTERAKSYYQSLNAPNLFAFKMTTKLVRDRWVVAMATIAAAASVLPLVERC